MTTIEEIRNAETNERLPVITQELQRIGGYVPDVPSILTEAPWPTEGDGYGQWNQDSADGYDGPLPWTGELVVDYVHIDDAIKRLEIVANRRDALATDAEIDTISAELHGIATAGQPEPDEPVDADVIDDMPDDVPEPAPVAGATYQEHTGWSDPQPTIAQRAADRDALSGLVRERIALEETGPMDVVVVEPEPEPPSRWRRIVAWLTRRAEDAEAF